MATSQISEVTRRNIIDEIVIGKARWSGRLEEPDFLSRIFELSKMPSTDYRFSDAAGDIWQHRIRNYDWEDDWVFNDPRFNLLLGDDETFLKFLCEMIHPVVRPESNEVEALQQLFNKYLRVDGYEIVERTRISDKPVFAARLALFGTTGTVESLREKFAEIDAAYVLGQITRMESAINDDPSLAIGTAKELVETCCKTILNQRGIKIEGSPDLPNLTRQTGRELRLTLADIPDDAKAVETIRRLLSNLASICQSLTELRNTYGTGHGRDAHSKGLGSRHAKLMVGAASTLAVFLIETHHETPKNGQS
jgi:hypothetical protein